MMRDVRKEALEADSGAQPECRGPRWPAGLGFKGSHHLAGSLSGEQETHSLPFRTPIWC